MNQSQTLLAYVDHSALNALTKGRRPDLRNILAHERIQVAYSDETLFEISKSAGYAESFVQLLTELKAKHITINRDEHNRFIDSASIEDREPKDVFAGYQQTIAEAPAQDLGFLTLLQKFFGGHKDKTFEEIFLGGHRDLNDLLENLKHELASVPASELPESLDSDRVMASINQLQHQLPDMTGSLGRVLDSQTPEATVANVEVALDVGPKVLQNIKGPNVVEQIWGRLSKSIPNDAVSLEDFFGLVGPDGQARSTPEKINAIYHQLNFLGYFRDRRLPRRLESSLSDMSHAGVAAFCHLFVSLDQDQVMKTRAVYEYLKIPTILYPPVIE